MLGILPPSMMSCGWCRRKDRNMSEKKLKLTLHGKCVGYELHRFDPDYGGMMIEHLPPSQARAYPVAPCHHVSNNYIQHDAVHDFVCLDRNGNAVYEGDIVMAWGRPRIVVWFPNSLVYRLEY